MLAPRVQPATMRPASAGGSKSCRVVSTTSAGVAGLLGGEALSAGNRRVVGRLRRCPPEVARQLGGEALSTGSRKAAERRRQPLGVALLGGGDTIQRERALRFEWMRSLVADISYEHCASIRSCAGVAKW